MPIASLSGVMLNEYHASPSGASQDLNGDGVGDFTDEFLEFYNASSTDVSLAGWKVYGLEAQGDDSGHVLLHTFEPGDTISAGGHFTLVDSEGGGTLTNVSGNAAFLDFNLGMLISEVEAVALYDPASNTFVVYAAANVMGQVVSVAKAVTDENAGATQVGDFENVGAIGTGLSASRVTDGSETWMPLAPTPGLPNCFAAGTRITTPDCDRAVETLTIGDLVFTADGRAVPVRWIGRQTFAPRRAANGQALVRVEAGSLGPGLPQADLTLTADHALLIGGLLVNAGALVNHTTIRHVPAADLPAQVTVYHIETDAHDIILANGCPAETFIDYRDRRAFDNFGEYVDLYGAERIIRERPEPRIASARMLPPALRARLGLVAATPARKSA